MIAPHEADARAASISAQLEALAGPQPQAVGADDPRRKLLCREAYALLNDEGYRVLVQHMAQVAASTPEPAPDLGAFQGTMSEYALFRMGATQLFRMIGRLAREATQED